MNESHQDSAASITISPPLTGGDKGEGEEISRITPTLALPHQGGGISVASVVRTQGIIRSL
jgi:hypothetical protein